MKSALFVLFCFLTLSAAEKAPEDRQALRAMVHRRHQSGDENSNPTEFLQRLAAERPVSPEAQTFLRYVAAAHKQGANRKRRGPAFSKKLIELTITAISELKPNYSDHIEQTLLTCPRPAITALVRAGYQRNGHSSLETTLVAYDKGRIHGALDTWLPAVLQSLVVEYVNFAERHVAIRLCDFPRADSNAMGDAPVHDLTGLDKLPGIDRCTILKFDGWRLGLGCGALFSDKPRKKLALVRKIFLRNNGLRRLKAHALDPFVNLTKIYLSNNNFTEMPRLVHAKLRRLNLMNNLIAQLSVGALSGMPKLAALDLRGNPIKELPNDVQALVDAGKLEVLLDDLATSDKHQCPCTTE